MIEHVAIRRLATGVPGLDAILGGGLPEFSFNLVTGPPGAGKTTLAHQLMFALATPEQPALFFTALGEPPWKMLRYQQQFAFFALDKIGGCIRFVHLNEELAAGDFARVLARISEEVQAFGPAFVFVDSFRSVLAQAPQPPHGDGSGLRMFTQQLGITLAGWQTTSFLIGEYSPLSDPHPVFTVADGILNLEQSVQRNSMVRKIQVLKMRGQATSPGMHTMRITDAGLTVFPSATVRDDSGDVAPAKLSAHSAGRVAMGVPLLDDMLGGGLPSGYSMLVAGPSGSGKTILSTSFLSEGVRRGEAGVIVAFEQTPSRSRTHTIDDMVRAGCLGLINTRLMDLSVDEIVQQLVQLVHEMKATRVVIDSLSGFELAVAPTFREDFRESLFRLVAVLSGLGVTVLLTSELEDRYTDLRFSPYGSAFLTDAIVVQRYIEVESSLQRVMAVVKVRGSAHSNDIRRYEINDDGIAIGKPILHYEGLFGGRPMRTVEARTVNGGLR
ncbi:circadian clock protein KaiC [Rhodoferax ferrireducens]|uniref:non-specific serine/threonine protein kinase n=1 Tax=Rhodoferax ferrireducens TaxID=192843 RepID=A0ABU2C3N0_9BURK|nr:ATPase domain-containing protein [Rhodoferax ferrireducens]MDR7375929.1 circadian clock protein KaiC [Rhodoferax ferrireducens]